MPTLQSNNPNMRYKISDSIQFEKEAAHLNSINTNYAVDERILIVDSYSDRRFFVNQTIKTFIEKFSAPKTFNEIHKEVALEVNVDVDKVKKITQPFLKYIKYRRFIVPENYVPKKATNKALFAVNTVLNEYKIENLLDINGDIDIYKAVNLQSQKKAVVKLLKQTHKKEIAELRREFNFLKALHQTETAPAAYKFITKENYAYFTQEFVEGLGLPQFIKRKKSSSQKLVFSIAAKIAETFKEIHAKNIVHGDIHPSNIIVTPENKIKVVDFGLSLNSELDKEEIVNFGGAYFFMPPERINKTTYKKFTRKPDFQSDVFQIGVVLYTLLYDEYPFNGVTWEELATEIKEKPVSFPEKSHFNFLIPGWLTAIIAKCVAKKANQRFPNAIELSHAFENYKR